LKDILENQQIELELTFKNHLIDDIIKAMLFIHGSEIKYHGNLTSTNCLVDSRFTLKITDFGLSKLQVPTYHTDDDYYKSNLFIFFESKNTELKFFFDLEQLWRAPELQSNISNGHNTNGSQKGDIYSFAIILQEILYRKGLFYLTNEDKELNFENEIKNESMPLDVSLISYQDIFNKVINKTGLRPSLSEAVCSKEIVDLLKKCWSDSINERPDFTIIRDTMRKITKISGNILDNLLARMEKYANNLEDLVKERTQECELEKKRAETLLYRLIPDTVAVQLMRGDNVKAESFDKVTIYFSDICGFTDLSANSTPMQVVHMLNALYTLFDSIIESFDVYKVETIGDAYMVVSGLPNRHEDHAAQIARMSLALLENVKYYKIPHLPDRRLELRIGLHTGPCVAGVVGLKMPRYCLFGDTVNTASRMESNGMRN
jgi:atrial natriuretic peptide receptor A